MRHVDPVQFARAKGKFARWLLAQLKRDDAVGQLSRAAHSDPDFPIEGDFADVAAWLGNMPADATKRAALDEAELDWCAL